ncbi:MAG: bifunctional diaminohydroxyphosphoribosylaminopyrimidine deaminase/5-amino-6-(5-phosphoribosylamino)uracil reductase RibD [Chloroherpetonaceae bacterium]|nr:bifunctional diaminohydroxyphosphoribosylaminopyrimidine deaminase/5-amino-6-(5-phosphoribosylamino)uracil reductase RibD [Chthonomonadaceae bacterium]MDW8208590.1 bifunctional diaminohydroxyphosphoribosylaminopyrimidine deaminase/5-amino-6-(5-phosphoribosylamino)uracil reductase RibD [Chloroherpetonaceae bacterium]
MRRALRLAGKGFTPPNPMVGCVIVRDGALIAEGYHPCAGQPHAEVFALRAAGERARGATVYVTLEPCCHWGRTPPCTEALIAAGVKRVVAATTDPDPRVRGQGLAQLRAAGIRTEVGLLEEPARRLNEAFLHFQETGRPFVTLKAAMTLDGKIATRTGDSKWITGEKARRYVHRLRAQSGAVLVGVGTVLADDPALTARLPGREVPRQPLRIIVDSHLRTPPNARAVQLVTTLGEKAPLLIAAAQGAPAERAALLRERGVEVVEFAATPEGRVDLNALMAYLGEKKVISLFVEGGGTVHAAMLEARLAHRVLFFVAPRLIGGTDAPTPIEGRGVTHVAEAVPVRAMQVRRFGEDIALEGYV